MLINRTKIWYGLVICVSFYCLLQLLGLKSDFLLKRSKPTEESDPVPYIVFLASILTPSYYNVDASCLKRLQNNRKRMSQLEIYLSHVSYYPELKEYVKKEFRPCVTGLEKNKTALIHKSSMSSVKEETATANAPLRETASVITPLMIVSCEMNQELELQGPTLNLTEAPPPMETIFKEYPDINKGLYPGPNNCKVKHSSVIIIPFRNRDLHLRSHQNLFLIDYRPV